MIFSSTVLVKASSLEVFFLLYIIDTIVCQLISLLQSAVHCFLKVWFDDLVKTLFPRPHLSLSQNLFR